MAAGDTNTGATACLQTGRDLSACDRDLIAAVCAISACDRDLTAAVCAASARDRDLAVTDHALSAADWTWTVRVWLISCVAGGLASASPVIVLHRRDDAALGD